MMKSTLILLLLIILAVSTANRIPSQCKNPQKVGPCRASLPRYFYNATTRQCEEFQWGGCRANRNNFMSLTECQLKCKPRG